MPSILKDDLDLDPAHVQSLSNRDEVVKFFALLGYNTDSRLTQSTDAMGITADSLKQQVRHIERIADQEDGVLQVYLCELKSVTQASIQAIARALRNRGASFLWVFTSDYNQLDFVLFEPTLPHSFSGGINFKGAFLRPRVLTVSRRNPTAIDLRVLRRFSYTELDADYQFKKLESAYNIADWTEEYFNNRALFSDYYLNHRLPETSEWKENASTAHKAIQALFIDVRERLSGSTESATRTQLLEPTLRTLGFDVQAGKQSTSDAVEPDYVLYDRANPSAPVTYCNAYTWDRNLDGRDERRDAHTPDENPGAVVVSLLDRDTDAGKAPVWSIVTNGKTWRLYSALTHSRATNYYEIDLEETLASPDPGLAFRYFWLIFRAPAFTGEPSFLNKLIDESALYAKKLEERLKDRVFEEIFPKLAAGFIADIRAREGAAVELSGERLNDVFQGTLTYLYRLLFLLYAEARDLLPVKEQRGYRSISLTLLNQEIASSSGAIADEVGARIESAYTASSTQLYDRLNHLFEVIDRGGPSLNVPLYNGGLFTTQPHDDDTSPEAQSARFLAANRIPDRYLAIGLDLLARDLDEKSKALAFIDYKSLGVRQLGSVYEGLLEFTLHVAAEPMAIVKGKKTEEIISEREAQKANMRVRGRLPRGTPYLENNKRERKASGSYYTPDYIVKYIVANTVGPVLEEKFAVLRPKLRQAQQKYQEAVTRQKAFQKQGMSGDDPNKVAHTFRALVDELFDVRVLDPAMGSGHFLVETVDFITNKMLTFLSPFLWNPIIVELRRTRESILDEMERQGVTIDPERLTDVNLLKRHVLKRCIYGVDLNHMAVELAKVSLWLDSFTLGAPLSFLDHHLKHGNSLVGAKVDEVQTAIESGQMSLFGSNLWAGTLLATDLMRHVGELEDVTAEQVRQSRVEFRKASDALAPFKRILDVYTSRWFGNHVVKAKRGGVDTDKALDFLRSVECETWLSAPECTDGLNDEQRKVAAIALQATRDQHFFHWQLEFPEAFFGPSAGTTQAIALKEDGGFDAVVGNPPYLSVEELGLQEKSYFIAQSGNLVHKRFDAFGLFIYQALTVLCKNAQPMGVIVPTTLFDNLAYSPLRSFLRTRASISHIWNLGGNVFEGANNDTCILMAKRGRSDEALVHVRDSSYGRDVEVVMPVADIFLGPEGVLTTKATTAGTIIIQKMRAVSVRFEELMEEATQGFVTGNNPAFLIPEHHLEQFTDANHLIQPVVFGQGIGRYTQELPDEYVLYLTRKSDPTLPKSVMQRLQPLREQLSTRREVRNGIIPWYSLQWPRSEGVLARKDALLFQIIRNLGLERRLIVAENHYGAYADHTLNVITVDSSQLASKYCLALLNSSLLNWMFVKEHTDINIKLSYLRDIPIRRVAFTTSSGRRIALAEDAHKLYERCISENSHEYILDFVSHHLSQKPEESDVVHDLLAYLAEHMILLNKEIQAEVKRFTRWLASTLAIRPDKDGATGISSLTGKSKLQNYLGDYQKGSAVLPFDDILDVLIKNKGRLGANLSDARLNQQLRTEYDLSVGVLRPVKAKLALTDSLIDQVVYKLYGLTEQEITIVEATNRRGPVE